MARFLSAETTRAATQRLIASRALSGFVDFLVLKRALSREGENSIAFSMRDANFTGAMSELAGTYPGAVAAIAPANIRPFVKVFGTADYLTQKYPSNGAADTLAGSNWRQIVRVTGRKPRRGSIEPGHEQHLAATLLKAGDLLPALDDAAIWFHRAYDLAGQLTAVADGAALGARLREAFVQKLGLTNAEIGVLFDSTQAPLAGQALDHVLQDNVADPREYLPNLPEEDTGTGELAELLISFETLANRSGLRLSRPLLLRFAAALGAKRFLILSGLAGSGKTKLAQAFARWLTPAVDAGQSAAYAVIPVGADWTGNDNILGYPDGLDAARYVTRPALDLIQRAALPENVGAPHFLILDEMNLSHVERYFADLLSLIESGETTELYRPGVDNDGVTQFRTGVEPLLRLPPNLFVIGTVNVDETTFSFAPKVLDRAALLEFTEVNLDMMFSGKRYQGGKHDTVFKVHQARFKALQALLTPFNLHLAYRAAAEILDALADAADANAEWDHQICHKVLPRIRGPRASVEPLLLKLRKDTDLCNCELSGHERRAIESGELPAYETSPGAVKDGHKGVWALRTVKKIDQMLMRAWTTGFTSYFG